WRELKVSLQLCATNEATQHRRSHVSRRDSHYHEDAKYRFRNDAEIIAGVQDDQLHQPSSVHHGPDQKCLAPGNSAQFSCDGATSKFAYRSHQDHNHTSDQRQNASQRPDVCTQAGESKEKRQKKNSNKIAHAVVYCRAERLLVMKNTSHHKCAENGEYAN